MPIEKDIKSFKKDKQRIAGITNNRYVYSKEEAYNLVVSKLPDFITQNHIQVEIKNGSKAYFRTIRDQYRSIVSDLVHAEQIKVRDYMDNVDEFVNFVVEEIVGYSVLAEAFYDPGVTDIFCNAWNEIFVERNGKMEPYPHHFRSPKHFKAFIDRVLRVDGKEINKGTDKTVAATFYEDRVEAIIDPVAAKGPSITFRKHSENHVRLEQLLDQQVMSAELVDLIGMLIYGECNLVVGGITGSGKTTTLRALLNKYANKRMLVVEDTQELFPEVENNLQLVTFKSDNEKENITLEDLIYVSLRLKPKYIVVGEVRGPEMMAAVEAMETGHSTLMTGHSDSPVNMVNRIVTKYLMAMPSLSVDVVERIIGSAIDYVIIQDDIPGIGRKVTSLTEVTYDYDARRIKFTPIYRYNFHTCQFEQLNKISAEKANKMLRRGVPIETLKPHVAEWN
jgi:pilus assembly protein CpaF